MASAEPQLSKGPAEETVQASQLPNPRPANGSLSSCFLCFSLSCVIVISPGEGRMDLRMTGNTDCCLLWGCTPTWELLTLRYPFDRILVLLSWIYASCSFSKQKCVPIIKNCQLIGSAVRWFGSSALGGGNPVLVPENVLLRWCPCHDSSVSGLVAAAWPLHE